MTITIPTRDLTGIIADAAPFAATDDDLPDVHCVRVEWDGEQLHAMATDRRRLGWSTWDPDDPPPQDEQDDLFGQPGGGDDPWHIYIPLPDAKDLIAAYKLPPKEGGILLTVEHRDGLLAVKRARDTGLSALTMTITGQTVDQPPNIRLLLSGHDAEPTKEVAYSGKALADFCSKVRQRGPLQLTLCNRITLVTIGERFTGAIVPEMPKPVED